MKNVVDLFVVKDRTAIFWFTMACASIFCSAMYVKTVVAAVMNKPQYVIMDGAGIYYLAPSVEFEQAKDLHEAQTRLAMETLYTRNPTRLVFDERVPRLFVEGALEAVNKEFKTEAKKFVEEQRTQTVEVDEIKVENRALPAGYKQTKARARLIRTSVFNGQRKLEVLHVDGVFLWKMNARLSTNRLFPSACSQVVLSEPSAKPKQTPL